MGVAERSSTPLAGEVAESAVFTVPAGATSGDLAGVVFYIETDAPITPPDSSWHEAEGSPLTLNENFGSGSGRERIFWSDDPSLSGTWEFSWTGAAWRSGAAVLWSGHTPGTGYPFGTHSIFEGSTTSAWTQPAVDVPDTGDGLVIFATQNTSKDITSPAPFTERQDNDEVYIATADNQAAGTTGTKGFSSSAGADTHAWMAPVLQVGTGGGTTPVGTSLSTTWNTKAKVTSSRSTLWNVASALIQVTKTLATSWRTLARVTRALSTTWNVDGPPANLEWFTEIGGTDPELVASLEDWAILPNAARNPQPASGGTYQTTYDAYFALRASQGFNAVETVMFNCVDFDGGFNGPDGDGVFPWNTNSLSPLDPQNAEWWDRRDAFFDSAAAHGFRVFINISSQYLDAGEFTASWSVAEWTAWGEQLAARYPASTHPHVFWIVGDDYFGTTAFDGLNALYNALNAGGATQPKSIQWAQEATSRRTLDTGDPIGEGLLWRDNAEYTWLYSYNAVYDGIEKAGVENETLTPIPYGWMDGHFLNSATTGLTSEQLMRRMIWWALSSGAKSFQVGNNSVYHWDSTSYAEASSNPFYNVAGNAIAAFFRSLPKWWLLKADTSSQLVTAGRGTHIDPIPFGGAGPYYSDDSNDYVTASFIQSGADAGKLAVIYMSHPSTIDIDESKMVAGYTATWVDPNSGAVTPASPGPTYTTVGKPANSDGQNDWVLVLAEPPATTPVSTSRSTSWNVRATVTATRSTLWDTLARVTKATSTSWRTLARTTATRATSWNVFKLGQVASSISTSWRTLQRVTKAISTTWTTRSETLILPPPERTFVVYPENRFADALEGDVMRSYEKDPSAELDYGEDWSTWLQAGETITSSTWTVDEGLVKGDDTGVDDGRTIVWLSGGTLDRMYEATNHITTSMGREDERTIRLIIRNR
jgi:hypothetical protein